MLESDPLSWTDKLPADRPSISIECEPVWPGRGFFAPSASRAAEAPLPHLGPTRPFSFAWLRDHCAQSVAYAAPVAPAADLVQQIDLRRHAENPLPSRMRIVAQEHRAVPDTPSSI